MKMPSFLALVEQPEGAEIRIDGEISGFEFWGDEFTPAMLREQLKGLKGQPLSVWINSPGGDVIAASEIYTALKEYPGKVTVKIDAIAASAASVISMAGDDVLMAPTAYMMIHNPWTMTAGNAQQLRAEAETLDVIADGIMAAYEIKTGKGRDEIKALLDANGGEGTWMSARQAVEMGFADAVLFVEPDEPKPEEPADNKLTAMARERFAARLDLLSSLQK